MTITLNSALGVAVVLIGISVVIDIAVSLQAKQLLNRCRDMLDFAFFMAARQDEWDTLLDGDENNHEVLVYHEGYKKGYSDGKYDGMKYFAQEHSEAKQDVKGEVDNDRHDTGEAGRV